jgi:hypothetical protein
MKKTLRVLATLSILASSILFVQPASAIGVLYSLGTNDNNGDVPCSVSGWITIEDNVVRGSSNCVGAVNIPFGPHTIGYMSLTGNAITSVTISDSVTHIRDEAFIRSNSIQSVTFGNSVQYIGGGAFAEMSALTSLTLPESLRTIDGGAFSRMNPAITSITIPNGVVGVGAWSFSDVNFTSYRYCGNNLSSWSLYRAYLDRIPNTCLTGIGSLYSSSIGSGDVACTTGFFTVLNNVVTRSTECSGVVNVPSGVTSIADGAFGGRAITSVTIPNSVLSIGAQAFGATGLTSLSIGNGLEYIGWEAFLWTDALSSYSYCGTLLSQEILDQRLSGKTKTCLPSTAPVTAGSIKNSQVATFSNGITEAVIPATTELPSVKLNFGGTAPQAVTVVPMSSNSAPLTATPFRVTESTKIVDIEISGTFNGVATVCLDGAATDSVFHFTNSAWVELANRSYANGQICGDTTSFSPFVAAPVIPAPAYVAPTPMPYLKTITSPKMNLKDGKVVCTPGTYNSGYTLDGVIQGSAAANFNPVNFVYDLLINGVAQTSKSVSSASTSTSWDVQALPSGSLVACSVTVSANSLSNTDKSTDNAAAASQGLIAQAQEIKTAETKYAETVSANAKAYQKALIDNRATWRKEIETIQSSYKEALDRIKAKGGPKAVTETSAALKLRIAASKKSAADYAASKPAALAAKEAANKAALDVKSSAIAKANSRYGTFIESIGYGVLIP